MNKLSETQFKRIRTFIFHNARDLDIKLFSYFFQNGSKDNVLNGLKKFQNSDGGFAYGLEPDFRTPVSSNIAATYAFQYLQKLSLKKLPKFMREASNSLRISIQKNTRDGFRFRQKQMIPLMRSGGLTRRRNT
ncbi:MAG: hypothetical protein PHS44_06370 [Candidatus Dojkabacteria bacterium]|jgi:hypothetical protein|nr:hypothetical protein [Candidatus Dojkabacteria bacterium]